MSSSSPWSSGADTNSIWNSNSPNLGILRRYSLRSTVASPPSSAVASLLPQASHKSTCSWEPSQDNKYLIGYIVIHRQDLGMDNSSTLGFNIRGGRPTQDGQYGAIVEHVVPGSIMNLICKLRVGDEIVEWNGFNLRNKRNDEVCDIIESVKNANSLRLVAVRVINNNNNSNPNSNSNNNNNNGASSGSNNNNKSIDVTTS